MDGGNDGSAGYFSWAIGAQSGGNISLSLDSFKWREYQLNANLYVIHFNQTTKEHEYQPFDIQSDIQVCRLGKNLYIYLIKLQPISQNFPTQTLLGYNLGFQKDKTSYDLSDFGLLSSDSPVSICYGNLQYPTFFIPATAKKTSYMVPAANF